MFEIEYKGANTVVISTKKYTVVVDPRLSVAGGKDVVVKDAVEVATEARFALNSPAAKLHIEGPGEYGFGEFDIRGIAAQRHLDAAGGELLSTIYRIEIGDARIALLGNIYEKLTEEQLEDIGVVDVLIIPVGGNGYTLDATGAAALARQIDAKVVIPIHYADAALTYEVPQDPLELFVKELGAQTEDVAKYKPKSFPEVTTIVAIARS